MRHIFTAVIAAIEAATIALAGMAVIALPVLLVGVVTFSLSVDLITLGEVMAAIWVFVHARHLHVSLSESVVLSFGIGAEPVSMTLTLAPLLIAILTATLAWRMGRRFVTDFGTGIAALSGGSLGFYGLSMLVASFAAPYVDAAFGLLALGASAWFIVPAWVGLLTRHADRVSTGWFRLKVSLEQSGAPKLGWRFETYIPRVLQLTVAFVSALVFMGAVAVTAALTHAFVDIVSVTQALQLDGIGSLVFFLGQLAYLPTFVIWAIAWLSGSGFAFGAGSSLSPFDAVVGPLPGVPVLAALPQGSETWGFFAVIVVVLAGAVVGALFGRLPEYRREPLWQTLLVVACAVVLAGLSAAGLFALASGSLGLGRLEHVGPDPWVAAAIVSAELAIGAGAGIALRRTQRASRDEQGIRDVPEFVEIVSAPAPAPLPEPRRAIPYESDAQPPVPRTALAATGVPEESDARDTEVISRFPRFSRIAHPDDDDAQPWFRRAASPRKPRTPRTRVTPEEPSEEELMEQFSWEARPDDDRT